MRGIGEKREELQKQSVFPIGRGFIYHGKESSETEKGPCPAIAEQWNAFQRSTLSQFLISRQFVCLGKDGKPKSGKHGVIGLRAITGRGCVNDGNRIIIIIMSVKKECPVDFSPQIRSMKVFPHETKVDIGVLPRAEASSRFRRPAQTYRLPNRSLVRKTRQGFRYH